jgi:hypothetical protein
MNQCQFYKEEENLPMLLLLLHQKSKVEGRKNLI